MRSPFDGVDIIDVAVHILIVRSVVGHSHFHGDALLLGGDVDDVFDKMFLRAVDVLSELFQPLLGVVGLGEGNACLVSLALVRQGEGDPGIEEGQFAKARRENLKLILCDGEDRIVWLEEYSRARLIRNTDCQQLCCGNTTAELLCMDLTITVDRSLEVCGEGIDTRDPDTVKTTRDLVGALVELTPCV